MPQIILQKFANREIRIGFQSISINPKNKGDKVEDTRNERLSQKFLDLYVSSQNVIGGFELGCDRTRKLVALPYTLTQHKQLEKRLDIISEFQQRSLKVKNKGGWGFSPKITAFGKNARHRLLEAGAILDKFYGKNVCEVTCTIPGSTRESFLAVSQWSGWIMNRITQIVRRSPHNPGWFYVWELQKRGALHLHFAIGCSNLSDAVNLAQEIEFKWFEVLLELKDKTGVDVFRKNEWWTWRNFPQKWKSHVLPVYKSVAAYFSKYVGKQSNTFTRNNKAFFPARWWGSSQSIKKGIENAQFKVAIEVSLSMAKPALSFLRGLLASCSPIKQYRYDFDLGTSASGTILGGGWREISYFDSERFSYLSDLVRELSEYVMQTWGIYADIPCLHADMAMQTSITGDTQA